MCFSATASFMGAGVTASIGVATLRHLRDPRTLLFANVPMLFAIHQFTGGLVWLGMNGTIRPEARGVPLSRSWSTRRASSW
jgi:hypothetical protein